jgi:hypothetical protein
MPIIRTKEQNLGTLETKPCGFEHRWSTGHKSTFTLQPRCKCRLRSSGDLRSVEWYYRRFGTSSWVKQPSQGPIRYPETLVINYQSFSVFEGVRRSIQRSVVLGYKNCNKMNLTVVPLEIFPQLWGFWLWSYGLRHRAVCRRHKSGCNLKLVHARQWRELTWTARLTWPARSLLAVTIPCRLTSNAKFTYVTFNTNWRGSMAHRKTQTVFLTNTEKVLLVS